MAEDGPADYDRGGVQTSRRGVWLVASWPLLLLGGCSSGHDPVAKELADLRSEVVKLRADTSVLNERVDALEIARGTFRGGSPAPAPASSGARPPLDVVRLGPGEAAPASEDADADSPRPVVRGSGGGVTVEEPAPSRGGPAAQKAYDDALELFRAKSYDKALDAFAGFLVKYPDHANVDNATYWRGESFLAKGDQRKAVVELEAVVANWPKGNKAPDALYKLVQTYAALGEAPRAEQAKKKLLTTYPQSEAAKKLRAKASPSPKP